MIATDVPGWNQKVSEWDYDIAFTYLYQYGDPALGVGRIVLTNAERVERHYFDSHILSEASFRPLLVEGLQQARDTRLPAVSIHRQFKVLVEDHLDTLFQPFEQPVPPEVAADRLWTVSQFVIQTAAEALNVSDVADALKPKPATPRPATCANKP